MAFWCAVQFHGAARAPGAALSRAGGLRIWCPRIRERQIICGRKAVVTPALFPTDLFVLVVEQWHAIRRTPYVVRLIMNGDTPGKCPIG